MFVQLAKLCRKLTRQLDIKGNYQFQQKKLDLFKKINIADDQNIVLNF